MRESEGERETRGGVRGGRGEAEISKAESGNYREMPRRADARNDEGDQSVIQEYSGSPCSPGAAGPGIRNSAEAMPDKLDAISPVQDMVAARGNLRTKRERLGGHNCRMVKDGRPPEGYADQLHTRTLKRSVEILISTKKQSKFPEDRSYQPPPGGVIAARTRGPLHDAGQFPRLTRRR